MSKPKRINKSQKQLVSEIQLTSDANRRRALIKDIIFPYLVDVNETIGYSKVFLQAVSGLIEGVFDGTRKTTTVGMIKDGLMTKLKSIFTLSDKEQKREYDRYVALLDKLTDISIQDFSYAAELPRYLDGYMTKDTNKQPIKTVKIDELLG
jgi:hypothetical protein